MLRYYTKCLNNLNKNRLNKNQKGEGEGSMIFIIIVICLLISGVFWFLKFIKDTKHERQKRSRERELQELKEKTKLQQEKHEPKGYLYYYKPGSCGEEPCEITRPDFGNQRVG